MKYIKLWIALSVAVAGLFFLFEMASASTEESTGSHVVLSECDSVVITTEAMANRASAATTWSERSTPEYRQVWLTMNNMVIGRPECFSPTAVAVAQANIQSYLGH